jgi:hypothetical protein
MFAVNEMVHVARGKRGRVQSRDICFHPSRSRRYKRAFVGTIHVAKSLKKLTTRRTPPLPRIFLSLALLQVSHETNKAGYLIGREIGSKDRP